MVNGKNVTFREKTVEKSPSPKRFEEPEGMTDIDLRRLSEMSGFSDSSVRKFNPKNVRDAMFKILAVFLLVGFGSMVFALMFRQGPIQDNPRQINKINYPKQEYWNQRRGLSEDVSNSLNSIQQFGTNEKEKLKYNKDENVADLLANNNNPEFTNNQYFNIKPSTPENPPEEIKESTYLNSDILINENISNESNQLKLNANDGLSNSIVEFVSRNLEQLQKCKFEQTAETCCINLKTNGLNAPPCNVKNIVEEIKRREEGFRETLKKTQRNLLIDAFINTDLSNELNGVTSDVKQNKDHLKENEINLNDNFVETEKQPDFNNNENIGRTIDSELLENNLEVINYEDESRPIVNIHKSRKLFNLDENPDFNLHSNEISNENPNFNFDPYEIQLKPLNLLQYPKMSKNLLLKNNALLDSFDYDSENALKNLNPKENIKQLNNEVEAKYFSLGKNLVNEVMSKENFGEKENIAGNIFNSVTEKNIAENNFNSIIKKNIAENKFNNVIGKNLAENNFNNVIEKIFDENNFNNAIEKNFAENNLNNVIEKTFAENYFNDAIERNLVENNFNKMINKIDSENLLSNPDVIFKMIINEFNKVHNNNNPNNIINNFLNEVESEDYFINPKELGGKYVIELNNGNSIENRNSFNENSDNSVKNQEERVKYLISDFDDFQNILDYFKNVNENLIKLKDFKNTNENLFKEESINFKDLKGFPEYFDKILKNKNINLKSLQDFQDYFESIDRIFFKLNDFKNANENFFKDENIHLNVLQYFPENYKNMEDNLLKNKNINFENLQDLREFFKNIEENVFKDKNINIRNLQDFRDYFKNIDQNFLKLDALKKSNENLFNDKSINLNDLQEFQDYFKNMDGNLSNDKNINFMDPQDFRNYFKTIDEDVFKDEIITNNNLTPLQLNLNDNQLNLAEPITKVSTENTNNRQNFEIVEVVKNISPEKSIEIPSENVINKHDELSLVEIAENILPEITIEISTNDGKVNAPKQMSLEKIFLVSPENEINSRNSGVLKTVYIENLDSVPNENKREKERQMNEIENIYPLSKKEKQIHDEFQMNGVLKKFSPEYKNQVSIGTETNNQVFNGNENNNKVLIGNNNQVSTETKNKNQVFTGAKNNNQHFSMETESNNQIFTDTKNDNQVSIENENKNLVSTEAINNNQVTKYKNNNQIFIETENKNQVFSDIRNNNQVSTEIANNNQISTGTKSSNQAVTDAENNNKVSTENLIVEQLLNIDESEKNDPQRKIAGVSDGNMIKDKINLNSTESNPEETVNYDNLKKVGSEILTAFKEIGKSVGGELQKIENDLNPKVVKLKNNIISNFNKLEPKIKALKDLPNQLVKGTEDTLSKIKEGIKVIPEKISNITKLRDDGLHINLNPFGLFNTHETRNDNEISAGEGNERNFKDQDLKVLEGEDNRRKYVNMRFNGDDKKNTASNINFNNNDKITPSNVNFNNCDKKIIPDFPTEKTNVDLQKSGMMLQIIQKNRNSVSPIIINRYNSEDEDDDEAMKKIDKSSMDDSENSDYSSETTEYSTTESISGPFQVTTIIDSMEIPAIQKTDVSLELNNTNVNVTYSNHKIKRQAPDFNENGLPVSIKYNLKNYDVDPENENTHHHHGQYDYRGEIEIGLNVNEGYRMDGNQDHGGFQNVYNQNEMGENNYHGVDQQNDPNYFYQPHMHITETPEVKPVGYGNGFQMPQQDYPHTISNQQIGNLHEVPLNYQQKAQTIQHKQYGELNGIPLIHNGYQQNVPQENFESYKTQPQQYGDLKVTPQLHNYQQNIPHENSEFDKIQHQYGDLNGTPQLHMSYQQNITQDISEANIFQQQQQQYGTPNIYQQGNSEQQQYGDLNVSPQIHNGYQQNIPQKNSEANKIQQLYGDSNGSPQSVNSYKQNIPQDNIEGYKTQQQYGDLNVPQLHNGYVGANGAFQPYKIHQQNKQEEISQASKTQQQQYVGLNGTPQLHNSYQQNLPQENTQTDSMHKNYENFNGAAVPYTGFQQTIPKTQNQQIGNLNEASQIYSNYQQSIPQIINTQHEQFDVTQTNENYHQILPQENSNTEYQQYGIPQTHQNYKQQGIYLNQEAQAINTNIEGGYKQEHPQQTDGRVIPVYNNQNLYYNGNFYLPGQNVNPPGNIPQVGDGRIISENFRSAEDNHSKFNDDKAGIIDKTHLNKSEVNSREIDLNSTNFTENSNEKDQIGNPSEIFNQENLENPSGSFINNAENPSEVLNQNLKNPSGVSNQENLKNPTGSLSNVDVFNQEDFKNPSRSFLNNMGDPSEVFNQEDLKNPLGIHLSNMGNPLEGFNQEDLKNPSGNSLKNPLEDFNQEYLKNPSENTHEQQLIQENNAFLNEKASDKRKYDVALSSPTSFNINLPLLLADDTLDQQQETIVKSPERVNVYPNNVNLDGGQEISSKVSNDKNVDSGNDKIFQVASINKGAFQELLRNPINGEQTRFFGKDQSIPDVRTNKEESNTEEVQVMWGNPLNKEQKSSDLSGVTIDGDKFTKKIINNAETFQVLPESPLNEEQTRLLIKNQNIPKIIINKEESNSEARQAFLETPLNEEQRNSNSSGVSMGGEKFSNNTKTLQALPESSFNEKQTRLLDKDQNIHEITTNKEESNTEVLQAFSGNPFSEDQANSDLSRVSMSGEKFSKEIINNTEALQLLLGRPLNKEHTLFLDKYRNIPKVAINKEASNTEASQLLLGSPLNEQQEKYFDKDQNIPTITTNKNESNTEALKLLLGNAEEQKIKYSDKVKNIPQVTTNKNESNKMLEYPLNEEQIRVLDKDQINSEVTNKEESNTEGLQDLLGSSLNEQQISTDLPGVSSGNVKFHKKIIKDKEPIEFIDNTTLYMAAKLDDKITNEEENHTTNPRISSEAKIGQFNTAIENIQSSQHTALNPNFEKQCIPVSPPLGASLPMIQQQLPFQYDPNVRYTQLIPVSLPKPQANSFVINPQITYVSPNVPQSVNGFGSFFPSGQAAPAPMVQPQTGPNGQYYICNPISGQNNQVAGIPGVEVRTAEEIVSTALNNMTTRQSDKCPMGHEICADDSKCIKTERICDGEVNCDDGSDEVYCSCKYRLGQSRWCDGYYDCPNGEDEVDCFGCQEGFFNCDDWSYSHGSTCIPTYLRCNGVSDCPSGTDEQECTALLDNIETSRDLFKVSNNAGFLHRNYQGIWYPVCGNPEYWALDACKYETGPSVIPPLTRLVQLKQPYSGHYANAGKDNEIHLASNCLQQRAVYVECPPPTCGIRWVYNNPYRREEVDTSAEEISARFNTEFIDEEFNNKTGDNEGEEELKKVLREKLNGTEGILGDGRVVGGRPCQPGSWPWVVSIYKNGAFHCGGVLISDMWLITAAHCTEKYWLYFYEIEIGMLRRFSFSPMQQTRYVTDVISHPGYDRKNLKNDLAMMRLNRPVKFNRYVRPICLPNEYTAGQFFQNGPQPGTICTAVGWGATVEHGTDPDHMREVEVPVLPVCKHKEDEEGNEICAGLMEGGKDACQGDSGGPFLCRNPNMPQQWYLAGIVSHGEGCARPNEPGVYTKVAIYRDWIYEYAKDDRLSARKPLNHCPGYTCRSINKCIPKKRRCDRVIDCLYGDDEIDCDRGNTFSSLFKHAVKNMMFSYDGLSRSNAERPGNPATTTTATAADTISTTFKMENSPITDTPNGNGFAVDDSSFASPAAVSDRAEFISNAEAATATAADVTTAVDESPEESISPTTVRNKEDGEGGGEGAKTDVNRTVMMKPFKGERFLCRKMLEVIPAEKKCDKTVDCQDGTDEESCACADYLRHSHPTAICDGVTDCGDLSDEINCNSSCSGKHFYCRLSKACVPIEKKCDNRPDCDYDEDEWDCFTLADSNRVLLDADSRPALLRSGLLAYNKQNYWVPLCMNFTGIEGKIAADACVSLGFSDYEKFLQVDVPDRKLRIGKEDEILAETEKPSMCSALYIKCSDVSVSGHEIGEEDRLNVAGELHTPPWNAAVYADGEYKCAATVLNLNWILTSVNCFPGILKLHQHYVAVLTGAHKGYLHVGGPHEQAVRVTEAARVPDSEVVLLRLEKRLRFTRYVHPLHFKRTLDSPRHKEKCFIIGRNQNQKSRVLFLRSLQNCSEGFRCFTLADGPSSPSSECEVSDRVDPLSGCVVCDSGSGFYPAAVFHEPRGWCGFTRNISLPNLAPLKPKMFNIMERNELLVEAPPCEGFRCNLGECMQAQSVCNGIPDCRDSADEESAMCQDYMRNCHLAGNCSCSSSELRCNNGKCVPKTAFCDQIDDCGDDSDEPDVCNCRSYLKLANSSKICDGVRNCLDKSDEDPAICKCNSGQFKCGKSPYCVSNDMVCDGQKNCPNGEDEQTCYYLQPSEENFNVGEVLTRSYGVWHPGCFPQNLTRTQLEETCKKIGFAGNNAQQLNTTLVTRRPTLDVFSSFWVHRGTGRSKIRLSLRSGERPFVSFVDDPECHRLFLRCL